MQKPQETKVIQATRQLNKSGRKKIQKRRKMKTFSKSHRTTVGVRRTTMQLD
jgi:hypothetical protein